MPNYRRTCHLGGTYLERNGNDLLVRGIDLLRDAVRKVRQAHPFDIPVNVKVTAAQ